MQASMRLLLIEDDPRLGPLTASGLGQAGFAVDQVTTGGDGLAALATTAYDVVILDLGLPDGDGLGVLDRLRRSKNSVPILILTARDGLSDRVEGLNRGADDYLLKPFAMVELVARVKALLRRPGGALGTLLTVGDASLDTVAREVVASGTPLTLSRREVDVMEVLMRRAGRVVPKDVIEEKIYGFDETISSNSVEVHVHRLRRKLAAAGSRVTIHTLRGLGYLLAPEPR